MKDITDISFNKCFIIGIKDDIISVLGFDTDFDSNSAEIWNKMIEILPKINITLSLN